MLMDDTALLATSRETLLKRYDALARFCEEYDMVINVDKTKFMVINGNHVDRESFKKGGLIIDHVDSYIYLGSPFSANGSVLTDIQEHADLKSKHVNKFNTFCFKNQSMPFVFKKKVFDAVLSTKLLYGCESWFTEDYKPIEVSYMSALKSLLGVRKQTPNQVVLTECGVIELKEAVRKHQQNFINSKLSDPEEPLTKVFELCRRGDTAAFRYIQRIRGYVFDATERRIESMRNSTKTKTKTYMTINPSCSVHPMYTSTERFIADYQRIEVTRFRLGSHRLKVETGRWSRIPANLRLCTCGVNEVQDEAHVVYRCAFTSELRVKYEVDEGKPLHEILADVNNVYFVYGIMNLFK
jgi:ribosomal protein L31